MLTTPNVKDNDVKTALIGYTGFVGSNLDAQASFDDHYNSKNIDAIRGQDYDLVVCAGAPAVKWLANRNPDEDWANLERLIEALKAVKAKTFILISTVDVYASPVKVDEGSRAFATREGNAYGHHRRKLEEAVQTQFSQTHIIRLPGLFGPGLKKNVIYDLLNGNDVHKIHSEGVFQYYNLAHLWADMTRIQEASISEINLAVEPFSVRELARDCFGFDFENQTDAPAALYDFRTRHSGLWGRSDGYLYGREQVKAELGEFIRRQRESAPCN